MAPDTIADTPASTVTHESQLRALAARYYTEDEVLLQEKENLFYRCWQYACHVSEVETPGSYVATDILGQNVFVMRGKDGEIRAFYNVCPHRGHKLVDGAGKKSSIVCPYHHWSFSLDGTVRGIRKTDTSHIPDTSKLCLKPVRVDRLLDFLFVCLDPDVEPIAEFWPGLEKQVLAVSPGVADYALSNEVSALHPVDLNANWKIHVDNFLECYHCRHGHESFSDMLDIPNQRQTLHKNYSYVFIPSSGKAENKAYPLSPEFDDMDLHFWHLFPNMGLAQFSGPGNLSLSTWVPVNANRAKRKIVQLDVAEPTDPGMIERRDLRTIWARDVLQPEDIGFIESVHEGMTQRGFDQGWYMIDPGEEEISEVMLRHFHQTYLAHMGETDNG